MNRGFSTILAAQFFSALGDNALLFAAIALLESLDAPSWQTPVLQQFFIFSYIALAPFVGAFSDALPKGQVMFISNGIKIIGCLAMLLGSHPLFAYGFVGIGAALYSPAKYGILTEYLPPHKLVWANGWMEGLTVAAIILGAIFGGLLIGHRVEDYVLHQLGGLSFNAGINTAPKFAILIILGFYFIAAVLNYFIPKLAIEHTLSNRSPEFLLADFWRGFLLLWKDPLGQVSLAVTSLFLGSGSQLAFDCSRLGSGSATARSGACYSIDCLGCGGPCHWFYAGSQGCVVETCGESITPGDSHGLRCLRFGISDRLASCGDYADIDRRPGRQFLDSHERIAATSGPPAYRFRTLYRRAKLQRKPQHFTDAWSLCVDDRCRVFSTYHCARVWAIFVGGNGLVNQKAWS